MPPVTTARGGPLVKPWRRRSVRGSTVPTTPSAPATPSTPSPADGATALYSLLSWASDRATSFDLYFGTSASPPLFISDYVGTTYVPTLSASTTYFWKIVARNAGGTATGPVWSFSTYAASQLLFLMNGALMTSRIRFPGGLSIHDVLGAQPNTANALFDTVPPVGGNAITIGMGLLDADRLLFGGSIQSVDRSYEAQPKNLVWPTDLIDHTFAINRRRPFGTFVDMSASDIARSIIAQFAAGFSDAGIADDLPAISINFDGQDDFMSCMNAIAVAINGRTKVDYSRVVRLFLEDTEDAPDPVDETHPPLNDPPVRISVDLSQVRTRVYGKGAGLSVELDIPAGETILPVSDGAIWNTQGGQAVVGTTHDSAQTDRLTYTSVHQAVGGSLVGTGAAPSAEPTLTLAGGTGLNTGIYQYAYTDVTAAGESLPSPVATITTGTSSLAGAPTVTGVGLGGGLTVGAVYSWKVTFVSGSSETTGGTASAPYTAESSGYLDQSKNASLTNISIGPAGTTARKIYRTLANGSSYFLVTTTPINDNTTTSWSDGMIDANLGAAMPSGSTTFNQVSVSNIAVGPSSVTSRKVYRTAVNGTQLKLLTTIADNTTQTYTDSTADGSLGANVPTSDTSGLTPAFGQVNPGASSIRVVNAGDFQAGGGWAQSGNQLIRYSGLGGTTQPPNALTPTATAGAGLSSGVYRYGYTWATAAGIGSESLVSPLATVTTGGGNNQVALSNIAVGPTGTLYRNIYRTKVGDTQLYYVGTVGDNVSTSGFTDVLADTSLVFTPLTIDTSHLSGTALLGIPASGSGSIGTTIMYGDQIMPAAALVGINAWNGLARAIDKGSLVHVWIQRDDLAAQAALGLLELNPDGSPSDGIREHMLVDERRTEESLITICDADLERFSSPIVAVTYCTRDTKSKAGKTVSLNLTTGMFDPAVFDEAIFDVFRVWGLAGDFLIQDVTITWDAAPSLLPRYTVNASSARFTLADLLRRVVVN